MGILQPTLSQHLRHAVPPRAARKSVSIVTVNQTALLFVLICVTSGDINKGERTMSAVQLPQPDAQQTDALTHSTMGADQKVAVSRVSDRYGEAGNAGWSPIPDVLLFNQHKLKLRSDDLIVLLNLMAHYYVKDEMPFIRPTTIAKRMGVSQRSVQRSIARLRTQGHITKRKHETNGHIVHDLSPLIARLQPFGEERRLDKAAMKTIRNVAQQERVPTGFDSRL